MDADKYLARPRQRRIKLLEDEPRKVTGGVQPDGAHHRGNGWRHFLLLTHQLTPFNLTCGPGVVVVVEHYVFFSPDSDVRGSA